MSPLIKIVTGIVGNIALRIVASKLTKPKKDKPIPSVPGSNAQPRKDSAMNTPMGGVIRHILTAAGGFLVAMGYVDESMMTEVIGAVSTLAGLVWSMISKKSAA